METFLGMEVEQSDDNICLHLDNYIKSQSWRIVVESVGSSCDDSESRFDLSQDLTLVSSVGF